MFRRPAASAALPPKPDDGSAPALGGLRQWIVIFAAYLLIAFLFHAAGVNLFTHLIEGGDGFTAGFPSKLFATHLSPWNPYVQLGQYSFANTQFQPFYPPALVIMAVFPNAFGYNLFILVHYALAGLFFYLFAKGRGLSAYAALTGGLIFMLSGFLSAHKGHQAMLSAAIWLPAMLLFIDRYASTRRIRELASVAIVFCMSILAGFPQVTVYSMMLVGAYIVFRFRAGRSGWLVALRSSVFALGVAGVLALLLSSLQLFAVAEALPQMTREKLTYGSFSEDYFPIYHLLAFVIPNILGGFFQIPTYSPELNVVEVYPYIGLLPLALAFLAFRYRRRQSSDVVFWTAALAGALVLAFGQLTPLNALMFHIPVYNLFRAPARHLLEAHFALCVLAAIALDFVTRRENIGARLVRRALAGASLAIAVVFAGVYLVTQAARAGASLMAGVRLADAIPINAFITVGTAKTLIERNLAPSFPTLAYPGLFLTLSLALLRLLRRPGKFAIAVLPVMIAADMYLPYSMLYDKPDISALGRPEARPETAFLHAQRFDSSTYRLFPADPELTDTYPLLHMTYGWSAVNDYTPMWLKRYVALTDFALNGAMPPQNFNHPNILAAAGAQYILVKSDASREILENAEIVHQLTSTPLDGAVFVPDHASAAATGGYRLQSPDGATVSMLKAEVPLRKSTLYRISFDAAAPSGISQPVFVNLYAAGYDRAAQYKIYMQLPAQRTHEAALINSGSQAPERAFVRIFTQSTTPVELGNLEVAIQTPAPGALPGRKIYQQVYAGADGIRIFRSALAQPRFRFVKLLRPSSNVSDARTVLEDDPHFDVATEALVEGISARLPVASGEILARDVHDNRMQFTLRTGGRSFFVVGDSWFPGWRATIDGKETPIYVVDGCLRGILLEGAGIHQLVMSYHPWSVPAGLAASVAGLILLFLIYRFEDRLPRLT